jgi:hypothetical protein
MKIPSGDFIAEETEKMFAKWNRQTFIQKKINVLHRENEILHDEYNKAEKEMYALADTMAVTLKYKTKLTAINKLLHKNREMMIELTTQQINC